MVKCLAKELSRFEGAKLQKIRELRPEVWEFEFYMEKKRERILITPRGIFKAGERMRARTPTPFTMLLRKKLMGKRLNEVRAVQGERIIRMLFGDVALYIELFRDGNLVLVERDKIIGVLRKGAWRHRTLKVGCTYQLPPKRGTDVEELTLEGFMELLRKKKIFTINFPPKVLDHLLSTLGPERTFEFLKEVIGKCEGTYIFENVLIPFKVEGAKPVANGALIPPLIEVEEESEEERIRKMIEEKMQEYERKAKEYREIAEKIAKRAGEIDQKLEEIRRLLRSGVSKDEIEKKLGVRLNLKSRKVVLVLDS